MRLTGVRIKGYRSVRQIRFPVGPLSVFVGRNGVGKTNLYRALALLHAAARGTITREIALEGGMDSVLWAGKERKSDPRRLILSAEFGDLEYTIEVGLPVPSKQENNPARVALTMSEPMVKEETIRLGTRGRSVVMMERKAGAVWLRDDSGRRRTYEDVLLPSETALASFQDAEQFPELYRLRHAVLDWRLYHDFRTDAEAPIRQPCLAIVTPTLSGNGHDLAAVIATVRRVREDDTEIAGAIEDAFPGSTLDLTWEGNRCSLAMVFPDGLRPPPEPPRAFAVHELSDGTLKYLCLVGALCGYRMPGFIALNEPEASLHPDLIAPLARLIVNAADRARVWVVTHSDALGEEIERLTDVAPRQVVKRDAETWIDGLSQIGKFRNEE